MKRINAIFFAATAAALSLASCSQENLAPAEKPQGELVTVHFGAESVIASTKATITTEDEKTFKSAWENGDVLSVEYVNDNGAGTVDATWQSSLKSFDAALPPYTGTWTYDAVYPAPASDRTIDFGSSRTQKGNVYNCMYDLMSGSAVAENAAEGKDDKGNDIIFEMDRQTAIAYFRLKTSGLDEDVVSATLSVEGDNAYIATKSAKLTDYAKGYELAADATNGLKEITIKFEGAAPKATDLKLWFNVLPTEYTSMKLEVETTGHKLTLNNGNSSKYEVANLYKVVKEIPADKWVAKTSQTTGFKLVKSEESDWSGKYILVGKEGSDYYAYDAANAGTDYSWGTATKVDVNNDAIDASNASFALTIIHNTTGTCTIKTDSGKYLSASAAKKFNLADTYNADNCDFTISFDSKSYAVTIQQKSSTKSRQIRYNHNNGSGGFRWYDGTSAEVVYLYKEQGNAKTVLETPTNLNVEAKTKTVSWDAVANAGSYIVTIGDETFDTSTNSYDASVVEDEYYNVAVVAVPSDKDNFKNSAAAELKDARFGTPKLATPVLSEGAIDETSIRVNWTVDSRAANGYNCEIYNGGTLLESKTIKVNYVVFSGLESRQTYVVKVNAIAVEGDKPYAASETETIELETKSTQQVSDVKAEGTYTIKNLTVYAVPNASNAIAGDETGFILVYKSSHGLKVGNTFDVAGPVVKYNGVWEFNQQSSITNKAAGETPVYSGAVEADESYLISYASSPRVEYVHAKGIQSSQEIKVGSQSLYMSTGNAETDGKNVEVYGFVYGYSEKYSNTNFVATSIELDSTMPSLSIDKASKTWASDETDAFVVNVTVNSDGGDWNVTPTSLGWAKVEVDKAAGTITVTPNGKNESDTANEATLTVTHASDPTLTKTITLKQNAAGTAAETKVSTLTLSSSNKFGTTTGSTLKADDNVVWTVNTTSEKGAIQNSYQKSYYGQQFGISGTAWEGTFDADFSGKQISKIEVTANTGGSATISAKVGNSEYGKSVSVTKQTNKEVVYTFESVATGKISLVVSNTSKAFYLGKIKVTYTE